jgi:hypothetical protein
MASAIDSLNEATAEINELDQENNELIIESVSLNIFSFELFHVKLEIQKFVFKLNPVVYYFNFSVLLDGFTRFEIIFFFIKEQQQSKIKNLEHQVSLLQQNKTCVSNLGSCTVMIEPQRKINESDNKAVNSIEFFLI